MCMAKRGVNQNRHMNGCASNYSILIYKYATGGYPWEELKSLNMSTINIVKAYVLIPPFSSNVYT